MRTPSANSERYYQIPFLSRYLDKVQPIVTLSDKKGPDAEVADYARKNIREDAVSELACLSVDRVGAAAACPEVFARAGGHTSYLFYHPVVGIA